MKEISGSDLSDEYEEPQRDEPTTLLTAPLLLYVHSFASKRMTAVTSYKVFRFAAYETLDEQMLATTLTPTLFDTLCLDPFLQLSLFKSESIVWFHDIPMKITDLPFQLLKQRTMQSLLEVVKHHHLGLKLVVLN